MGCIYLYTNKINGKQYIGQTIQPIQVRHYNHLHQNNYFDRVLKKYGESNFTLEILEDNIFDSEELDKKEQYYIEKYNTYYDGYNLTFWGQGKRELFDRKLGKQVVNLLKTTELTYEEIGKQCNCSISTISDINNGNTYIQTDIDYPIRKKPSWYKFGDNEIKLVIYYLQNTKYTHWKIAEITDTNKNFVDDINMGKRKNLPKNIKFPIRDNPKREDINLILARTIVELLKTTEKSAGAIGLELGVSCYTVGSINRGKHSICRQLNESYPIRKKQVRNHTCYTGRNLTDEQIYQIIDLLRNTTISTEEIAQRYSVHKTSIDRINQGKTFVPITSQYNLPLRKSNRKSW